jgi:hypothetical protein
LTLSENSPKIGRIVKKVFDNHNGMCYTKTTTHEGVIYALQKALTMNRQNGVFARYRLKK